MSAASPCQAPRGPGTSGPHRRWDVLTGVGQPAGWGPGWFRQQGDAKPSGRYGIQSAGRPAGRGDGGRWARRRSAPFAWGVQNLRVCRSAARFCTAIAPSLHCFCTMQRGKFPTPFPPRRCSRFGVEVALDFRTLEDRIHIGTLVIGVVGNEVELRGKLHVDLLAQPASDEG